MIVGNDFRLMDNVKITYPDLVEVGDHCAIDWGFYNTTAMKLGNYVHIAAHCVVTGGPQSYFEMGSFSGLSAGCIVFCSSDDFSGEGIPSPIVPMKYRKVTIGRVVLKDYVIVGSGSIVFPNVVIAEGCVVGANSMVREDTEPFGVYVGSPARRVRDRSRNFLKYIDEIKANDRDKK